MTTMLKTENKITLAEKAYQLIEELIVTLELAPGTIFSETTLAEALGIGRTPLREALKKMASEQLVTPIARRGIQVVEINIADQLQLLETRRVLDKLIAQRAAQRATEGEQARFRTLGNSIYAAAANEDLQAYIQADYEFDQMIMQVANNRFAAHAAAPLHVHSRRFWYAHQQHGDWLKIAKNHQALAESLAGGDIVGAARHTDELVDYLLEFTKSIIEKI